jgi:hypothetical protein
MKTYHLNMVLDDSDNLVASYDSLDKLRSCWKQDGLNFLECNGVKTDWSNDIHWHPYFTGEDDDGGIRELSPVEVLGCAA